MEYEFNKKRIIVTGAGKGIGRDISLTLAKHKANVIAISRTQSDLDSLKQEDGSIETYQADISDWDVIEKLLIDIGPVDGLVNNAGINIKKHVLDITKDEMDSIIDINFKAPFHLSQVVARQMVKHNRPGVIVNISSIAAKRVVKQYAVYSCSKAAVDRMTKSMAQELGAHNIRVNSVNPSFVMTDMGKNSLGSHPGPMEQTLSRIPLGRFLEMENVTSAVMYLLSDKASMISGVTMVIDGGHITTFL